MCDDNTIIKHIIIISAELYVVQECQCYKLFHLANINQTSIYGIVVCHTDVSAEICSNIREALLYRRRCVVLWATTMPRYNYY